MICRRVIIEERRFRTYQLEARREEADRLTGAELRSAFYATALALTDHIRRGLEAGPVDVSGVFTVTHERDGDLRAYLWEIGDEIED